MFTDAHDPFPRNPNLIGFSFSWELDYVNVLNILEDLGIPVRSEERLESGSTCFVFGGGAVLSANPEPFADFFDVILMGDGEELLGSFVDAFEACVSGGGGVEGASGSSRSSRRLEILSALAQVSGRVCGEEGWREPVVMVVAEAEGGWKCSRFWLRLVPGVYVPLLYRVEYHRSTGPIADVSPLQLPAGSTNVSSSISTGMMLPAAPAVVERQTYRGKQLATSTVVSPRMAWEGIYMVEEGKQLATSTVVSLASHGVGGDIHGGVTCELTQTYRSKQLATLNQILCRSLPFYPPQVVRSCPEVVRSCPEVCRFCLASYSSLPFRPAALEDHLIPAIERGLQVTNRIGLLGASVTQHPHFDSLLSYLLQPHMKDIRLSIASVRTNTVTAKLAAALAQSGTRSLTIAVESAGLSRHHCSSSQRTRGGYLLDSADIVAAAVNAQEGGLSGLKLYGMVGLPSETDADVAETVGMMRELRRAAPRLKLTLGCSTFVPKAHTPFQWQPVQQAAEARLRVLEKEMQKEGVEFRPESYKWSVWQAVLSRGDRRLSRLLQRAREFGGSQGSFGRAFKEMKGQVGESEVLPWAHLSGALPVDDVLGHLPLLSGTSALRHLSSQAPLLSGTSPLRHLSSQAPLLPGTSPPRHLSSQAPLLSGTSPPRHLSSQAPLLSGTSPPRQLSSQAPLLSGTLPVDVLRQASQHSYFSDSLAASGTSCGSMQATRLHTQGHSTPHPT
ncbi:unnamed protein product [Closterium sp. Naga37s-1]|nr:unnamed protein product [Closterium sp. Naga37s-1]